MCHVSGLMCEQSVLTGFHAQSDKNVSRETVFCPIGAEYLNKTTSIAQGETRCDRAKTWSFWRLAGAAPCEGQCSRGQDLHRQPKLQNPVRLKIFSFKNRVTETDRNIVAGI